MFRDLLRVARHAQQRILFTALLILAIAGAVFVASEGPVAAGEEGHEETEESLGSVTFPISCEPAAQEAFERGIALLHHMMYVEARETFQGVAEAHPDCAMAHWGVAMTLFQPLWPTRPGPEQLNSGWEAVERALEAAPDDERQKAFIGAAEAFYREPEGGDYWLRIHRFRDGIEGAYKAFSDDNEAKALYALALLATAAQAEEPLTHNAKAAKLLLEIYNDEPTHPGAVHYTIHANDVDGRARESLEVVRSYGGIAPSVPHALHMPTHIFVRLGEWDDVILWNQRSAEAALAHPAGDDISHHYPHALDYLIYAYLQQGKDGAAKEILGSIDPEESYQKTFISAFHLAAIPARYYVERREWENAAALPERSPAQFPWEKFPWPESMTQFARGMGAAKTGDHEAAAAAVEKLAALEAKATAANESYMAKQVEVSRLAVAAWAAHAKGMNDEAKSLMASAAELEASMEKHPVTPGALQPIHELLGELLGDLGEHAGELTAYKASLAAWPGRYNSLLGAARAAAALEDRDAAASYYSALLAQAPEGDRDGLSEARAYLAEG